MPQHARKEVGDNAICQDCLEREMANWLESEPTPELARYVSSCFNHLLHEGRCVICGAMVHTCHDFAGNIMFDCLSEELENSSYRDFLSESTVMFLS